MSSCSGPGQIKIIRYKNPIPSLSWETTRELSNFPLITRQSISKFPGMITQQTHVLSGISIHRSSSTSNRRTLRKWSAAMNQLTTCLYVWIFNIFFTIVLHDYLFLFISNFSLYSKKKHVRRQISSCERVSEIISFDLVIPFLPNPHMKCQSHDPD